MQTRRGSTARRRPGSALRLLAALAVLTFPAAQVVLAHSPTGNFTISDNVPEIGQSVTFTATDLADHEGGTPTVSWTFGDGGNGNGSPISHSYSTGGTKTVRMRIADPQGEDPATNVTKTLRVNAPPTAAFNFSPASPTLDQQVTFTSTSSDPEGAVTPAWDLDDDGQFDDGSGTSATWSFATVGNKTVRLRVTDGDGATRTTNRTVPVGGNTPPTASFTFSGANPVTPNVPDVNETINLASTSTDANGNGTITRWDWDLDNDGQFDDRSGVGIQHSFATRGMKTVGLRVTDSSGAEHSTTRTLRVNELPVARIGILNPQAEAGQRFDVPLAGQPFVFTAGAIPAIPGSSPAPGCPVATGSPSAPGSSDFEAAIGAYEWDLDNDGAFDDGTGQNVPGPSAGFPAGARTVGLRVTDSDGGRGTATLQFRVNAAPSSHFVLEPLTPVIGQEVTFSSTSTDPDAADSGQLVQSWDLDDDGIFCEPGEQGQSVKGVFAGAGTRRIRLLVTDTGGVTREIARNVLVQNTLPTGAFGFSPDAPLPGQAVTFSGSGSSPAGKAIAALEWDFDFDPAGFAAGAPFEAQATGESVSHSFASPGAWTVALRITEAGGGFAIVTGTVVVNAPPVANFSMSDESPAAGAPVTISSTSADPDGPLASQSWDLDGDGQFDDATGPVITATFARAGAYALRLRVADSRGATSSAVKHVTVREPAAPPPRLLGAVIAIKGSILGDDTQVKRLLVRAPAGSTVTLRCRGWSCPKRVRKASKRLTGRRLRFKKLERTLRPGTVIVVRVTRSGFIGRQTTFTMRDGLAPKRVDLCLPPGAKRAGTCPAA